MIGRKGTHELMTPPVLKPLVMVALLTILGGTGAVSFALEEKSLSGGQPELRLTLRDAMQASVDQNPTVLLFKERITQAQDQADTQLGELLPNLSANMSWARRRFFLSTFGGSPSVSAPRDFYGTRVFLTQNLFSLSLIHKWRAARTNVEVAGLDAEITQQDTMATVGLVYLETLRAKAAVHAREADVTLNQELLRLARERKAAGMATSLDVTRARVQLENEKQRLLVAQNAHDRATLTLIRAIGLPFEVRLVSPTNSRSERCRTSPRKRP